MPWSILYKFWKRNTLRKDQIRMKKKKIVYKLEVIMNKKKEGKTWLEIILLNSPTCHCPFGRRRTNFSLKKNIAFPEPLSCLLCKYICAPIRLLYISWRTKRPSMKLEVTQSQWIFNFFIIWGHSIIEEMLYLWYFEGMQILLLKREITSCIS